MINMTTQSMIHTAVDLLQAGGTVAFPTETVYGLGADAMNAGAVERVFHIKNRPLNHPLIVHVANITQLIHWVESFPPVARVLAKAFWPGPLTMILKKRSCVLDAVTGGQSTIAIRIPRHALTQQLLTQFGGGIVGPSANRFTRISPTTALAVREELGEQVDFILDGGPCQVGVESTIVSLIDPKQAVILRPGQITAEQITKVANISCVIEQSTHLPDLKRSSYVPGGSKLHYAPITRTCVMSSEAILRQLSHHTAVLPIACLLYNLKLPSSLGRVGYSIEMPKLAIHYAHSLYSILREIDRQSFYRILIEAVPRTIEWTAIWDRISKASGSQIIL